MKRIIALALSIVTFILCSGVSVFAATSTESEMVPYYNNTNSASVTFAISSTGKATFNLSCIGKSGVTTKITAVSYIQRKVGLIWVKVDNGLDGKKWTDTVNGTNLKKSHSLQLSKTGTYRVKAEYTVYGSGGSEDVIEKVVTATY